MMGTNTLDSINRNMDQQLRVLKELLEAVDECEKNSLLEDISETELQQIKDYCSDMALAANTAKKIAKNLRPLAEEEDARKKAEKEAEEKAKKAEEKKKKAEAKKAENAAKKQADAATEQGNLAGLSEEEDLSFLE